MINGHDAPPPATNVADNDDADEAALRAEIARLRRMVDAVEALLDRHHHALASRRRREAAS